MSNYNSRNGDSKIDKLEISEIVLQPAKGNTLIEGRTDKTGAMGVVASLATPRTAVATQAVNYVQLGFKVFQCEGKAPFAPTAPNGCNSASDDPAVVAQWWNDHPNQNIGIKCENCLVIDIDVKDGKDGRKDLKAFEAQYGELPAGPKSMTASGGGFHLFFKRPTEDIVASTGLTFNGRKTGIDVRVGNSYVVAPPSTLHNGSYEWAVPLCKVNDLPELPHSWIGSVLKHRDRKEAKPSTDSPSVVAKSARIDDNLHRRIESYIANTPEAISGLGGHNQTFTLATALVWGFNLSDNDALDYLIRCYNPRCQPAWNESELRHKIEDARKNPPQKEIGWLLNNAPKVETNGEVQDQEDDEEDVIEFGAIPRFPLEVLPKTLAGRGLESAQYTGVDVAITATGTFAAVGAAMGFNFVIEPFNEEWQERSLIWAGAIIGTGRGKSPAMKSMIEPILKLQNNLVKKYREILISDQTGCDTKNKRPVFYKPLIKGSTVEALSKRISDHEQLGIRSGMLAFYDELSYLTNSMNQYKGGNGGDFDKWLSLGDGAGIANDIITRESDDAEASHLCVLGGYQPFALEAMLKKPMIANRGFIQRFLLAKNQYPEKSGDYASPLFKEDYQNLLNSLYEWNFNPITFPLDKEAQNLFKEYVKKHNEEIEDIDDDSACRGALISCLSKSNKTVLRIALLFHVVEMIESKNTDAYIDCMAYITADTMTRAITVTEYYKSVFLNYILPMAFPQLDSPKTLKARILALLSNAKEAKDARAIYKTLHSSAKVVKAQLTALVSEGKVIVTQRPGKQGKQLSFYSTPEK